jgi:hypothetical protein
LEYFQEEIFSGIKLKEIPANKSELKLTRGSSEQASFNWFIHCLGVIFNILLHFHFIWKSKIAAILIMLFDWLKFQNILL